MTTPPPNTGSSKIEPAQTATPATPAHPEMTVEELLNFSFREVSTAKIGSIVRRGGLACS